MGRPRTALIDRERIATIALELVDGEGEFSVVEIARRLGVRTASLYHHVDGRDGIVELLRERVCADIDATALGAADWQEALAGWARSYRAAFAAHPRAIPLLMASPVRAPRVLSQYERAVGVLLAAGFPQGEVMKVIIALENLILGSALDLAAPQPMWVLADESKTPKLAGALAASPAAGRADAAFELALGGCLVRLAALRDTAGA
ncbi:MULTISPECIES: TetR/AcrR family transcriptional regulator [Streptomyces]|uniref:TetR family transcriptional regulator n=1 Tax=Streptomyces tsukubensis (strain DSM 42081 / NBRC 108919 / NRRL 18488 / 9993) TaxID=1114943 RepID=I2MX99_STRT9|nr:MULTISPECIES: TetR/AcrR family transcriptional regulator C-terminal domain-containing protein [Streptomyces]AZK93784.1 TetR family transcriptional regulator [Streptomyces tsukubensis]EIF89396.1 transcriptional regulator [Streptomyces tsukubensis NRRL18488]MYS67317.1 TetR/AcrR family transcriptional regulator [Streptomyces sp. SID5473]QKM70079.1 TetR family transcriptional regulator [Streptomyces tsukubensis NRRL18488]TAI45945.1 TetR/AcrR family transcriptional regulator [Streptomyces tsukub